MTTARVGVDITGRDLSGPAFDSAINRIKKLDTSASNMVNRQRNMVFQLNDVFTQLGSGTSPMTVLLQQGPQIAQIYGFGNGGVGAAFRDLGSMIGLVARKAGPIAAIGGFIATGLTYEVNRASDSAFTMGEVFKATGEVIWDSMTGMVQPAISAIAPWVSDSLNWALDHFKNFNNKLIGGWNAAFHIIKRLIFSIPDAAKIAGMQTANFFIEGIDKLVQGTIFAADYIDKLMGGAGIKGSDFSLQEFKFDTTAATKSLKGVWDGAFKELVDDFNYDYLGQFYKKVGDRAASDKAALLKKLAPKKSSSGGAAGKGKKGKDDSLGEAFGFGGFEEQISVWSQLADIGKSKFSEMFSSIVDGSMKVGAAFKKMASSMLADVTKLFLNNAMQQLFSPRVDLYGAGSSGFGSSIFGSIFSSMFGGPRAGGGPVSGGKGYLVGENGPEFFSPGQSGYITPNRSLGGRSGGVTIIDQRSNAPQIEQKADGLGNMQLIIRDAVKRELPGQLRKQVPAQFGLQHKNKAR